MLTNAKVEELEEALDRANKVFDNNLDFRNLSQVSANRVRFTLRVNDSHGSGARVSFFTGRHTVAANWYAHGVFFAELFKVNPNVWVKSSFVPEKITKEDPFPIFVLNGPWGAMIDCREGSILSGETYEKIHKKYL